ncbi:TetR/AcrR family transcriptional regulator [Blastococcus saxobsidens]|uniref:Transcriptional regulator, TetR family n=1 Tax=Blastococcus saxobsidens (strain DD2) TaxID=1146883 RepID=H6RM41_BLASD|nr:helix-turn-helix domain-containing protein [Blastococcus saxobsidens]CCG01283.1 Transcriptional regulator, TetR family [Blastococcus saxobsidens DD2]
MNEGTDRRAAKKARTRAHIRAVAHAMFADQGFDAVTIADIARRADVAVQTVFNHFPTKEELFFDGRIPWSHGPADAVRNRPAGVSPLAALADHLADGAARFVGLQLSPEGRAFTEVVRTSPALAAYEQRVLFEAEPRLAAALAEAWETDPEPGLATSPVLFCPRMAAPLAAALWLAVSRVVATEQRLVAEEAADRDPAAEVRALADRLMSGLHAQLGLEPRAVAAQPAHRTG